MVRGYLNGLSFPAETMEEALALLAELRAGMALMRRRDLLHKTILCNWRVDALPLTAKYETLRDVVLKDHGRFRDTILFFLQVLDQRSPVTAVLSEEDAAETSPHVIDGLGMVADESVTAALVACALDHGVMLSLGSAPDWQSDRIAFKLLTDGMAEERSVEVANLCDAGTAETVAAHIDKAAREFSFANWARLTGDAQRSVQVEAWCDECRLRPGLEHLVMRTVGLAHAADYRPDGDMIKKLAGSNTALFEVRIYYAGTNNIRLLFARDVKGAAIYGYAGAKTAGNSWYKTAIPQALANIARIAAT